MRLYLASNDLGDYANILADMTPSNKKALIISNARDHRTVEGRKEIVNEDMAMLSDCGFAVTELDLRNYIGKTSDLRKYIDDFAPGLVFSMGGNLYSLATTLHLSGMDEILRKDLAADKYAYGGYSAGSMVASHDLMNYADSFGRRASDRLEQATELYGELITSGLGLIDEYVIPHADEERFKAACEEAEITISNNNLTPIVLNNSDVVVMNNGQLEVLRK